MHSGADNIRRLVADFIYVAPKALPERVCEAIVSRFDGDASQRLGRIGDGVDTRLKCSSDITISRCEKWADVCDLLEQALMPHIVSYVRAHPFLAIGGTLPEIVLPGSKGRLELNAGILKRLSDKHLASLVDRLFLLGAINIQQYEREHGGFPHWHCEIYPGGKGNEALRRVLFFIFFLNDVVEGGETDFYFQNVRIRPRRGTLLIAPAGWTHTHRGCPPLSERKLIATSWVLFRQA
jgi:hypothetical protein